MFTCQVGSTAEIWNWEQEYPLVVNFLKTDTNNITNASAVSDGWMDDW